MERGVIKMIAINSWINRKINKINRLDHAGLIGVAIEEQKNLSKVCQRFKVTLVT
jgi:hypothetical protein